MDIPVISATQVCCCCWAIGVFSLSLLARLREMSLGRITLVWVDILVGSSPVELFGTSPVREFGFGELYSRSEAELVKHFRVMFQTLRVELAGLPKVKP